jgi:hypothetical protein
MRPAPTDGAGDIPAAITDPDRDPDALDRSWRVLEYVLAVTAIVAAMLLALPR